MTARLALYAACLLGPVALAHIGYRYNLHPWTHPALWLPLGGAALLRHHAGSWKAALHALTHSPED